MDYGQDAARIAAEMRHVRQIRQYRPEVVPDEIIQELLEVARWTGSSRNTQPWHFVVLTDPEQLRRISQVRDAINWVATAPLAIAIVLNGQSETSEAYDEGRVTERLLLAARFFGIGGGTAWFGNAEQQRTAKEILGVPSDRATRSVVALGYPITSKDPRPNAVTGGRRPLSEIVSYNRLGNA